MLKLSSILIAFTLLISFSSCQKELDGGSGGNAPIPAQKMGRVQKQIAKEVAKSDFQPAENLRDVELFPKGQLAPADNFYPI